MGGRAVPYGGRSLYGLLARDEALAHAQRVFDDHDPATAPQRWEAARARLDGRPVAAQGLRDLPAAERHCQQVVSHAAFPMMIRGEYRFAEAEIAPLLACTVDISADHVEALADGLGPAPTREAVLEACLRTQGPRSAITLAAEARGGQGLALYAHNPNLRVMRVMHGRDGLTGYLQIALTVGFGNQHVTLARLRGELLVVNGHHTLCALLRRGVDWAPCILQDVASFADLGPAGRARFSERLILERRPTLGDFERGEPVRMRRQIKALHLPVEELLVPAESPDPPDGVPRS